MMSAAEVYPLRPDTIYTQLPDLEPFPNVETQTESMISAQFCIPHSLPQ